MLTVLIVVGVILALNGAIASLALILWSVDQGRKQRPQEDRAEALVTRDRLGVRR